jgi:hypothetical protein
MLSHTYTSSVSKYASYKTIKILSYTTKKFCKINAKYKIKVSESIFESKKYEYVKRENTYYQIKKQTYLQLVDLYCIEDTIRIYYRCKIEKTIKYLKYFSTESPLKIAICCSKLTKISKSFGKLTNLSYFELYQMDCELVNFSKFFTKLTNLKSLLLYKSTIKLPNNISHLTKLVNLTMINNKFYNISKFIKNIPNLQTLHISPQHYDELSTNRKLIKNITRKINTSEGFYLFIQEVDRCLIDV